MMTFPFSLHFLQTVKQIKMKFFIATDIYDLFSQKKHLLPQDKVLEELQKFQNLLTVCGEDYAACEHESKKKTSNRSTFVIITSIVIVVNTQIFI